MSSITPEQVLEYQNEVASHAILDSEGEYATQEIRNRKIDIFLLRIIQLFGRSEAIKIVPYKEPTSLYAAYEDKIYVSLWSYCEKGILVIRNPAKGNCGYQATSAHVEPIGYHEGHKLTRKKGVKWGKENMVTLQLWGNSPHTGSKDEQEIIKYLDHHLGDKIWIDCTMFNILACAYKRLIEIYKFKYETHKLRMVAKYNQL